MKKIGIIGGAGPMASCQLYRLLIEEFQQVYGSVNDADFPEIVIVSYPFADMLSVQSREDNRRLLINQLQACFDQLVACNVDIIAIACNTLHTLLSDIVLPAVECIDISKVAMAYAERQELSRLLVLATSTTIGLRLYDSSSLECLVPTAQEQRKVDQVIKAVLAGNLSAENVLCLQSIIDCYQVNGVVLGCTELPLLFDTIPSQQKKQLVVLDTLKLLASELARRAVS